MFVFLFCVYIRLFFFFFSNQMADVRFKDRFDEVKDKPHPEIQILMVMYVA